MALATCRECGKEVSTGAKRCPHCGVEHPVRKPVLDMGIGNNAQSCFTGCIALPILLILAVSLAKSC